MTTHELEDAFRRHGIRPDAYDLHGEIGSETYVLRQEGAQWLVFYSERGRRNCVRSFSSETAACEHMLDRVLSDPTTASRRQL